LDYFETFQFSFTFFKKEMIVNLLANHISSIKVKLLPKVICNMSNKCNMSL